MATAPINAEIPSVATVGPLGKAPRTRKPQPTEPPPWETRGAFMGEPIDDAPDVPLESRFVVGGEASGTSSEPSFVHPTDSKPGQDVGPGPLTADGGYEVIDGERRKSRAAKKTEQTTLKWLATGQLFLVGKGDTYCARAVGNYGPAIAEAMGAISDDFPWIAKSLSKTDKWGSVITLATVVTQLGVTMAVHHDLLPYNDLTKLLVPPIPEKEHANRSH